MTVSNAIVPFAAVIAVCVWQLWSLRRQERQPSDAIDAPRDCSGAP